MTSFSIMFGVALVGFASTTTVMNATSNQLSTIIPRLSTLSTVAASNDTLSTVTQRATDATTMVAPLTTTESPMNCFNHLDGLYQDPLNACSEIFYICANGRPFKFNCPSHLRFSVHSNKCDFPANVPACN